MSNLLEFLENLKSEVITNQFSYIYYDKADGKIAKISSKISKETDLEMLQVPHETVRDILVGTKKMQDFVVTYDVSAKQFLPREITYENDFTTIEYKLYQLPVVRTSSSLMNENESNFFEHIYDGINVVIYDPTEKYYAKQIVWSNNTVYKLKNDLEPGMSLIKNSEIYIYDVKLIDIESNHKIFQKNRNFELQYEDIHVDVWYDELEHLKGQHVWVNNTIYVCKKNIKKNTKFSVKNFDILLENVKLYEDSNENLIFDKTPNIGDLVLKNNKIYLANFFIKDTIAENVCVFYLNDNKFLFFDKKIKNIFKMSINEINGNKETEIETTQLNYHIQNSFVLNNKDKVLIGDKLYQTQSLESRGVDVVVAQNNKTQSWQIVLNKTVRKKLKDTNFNNDTLYFSITAKHDPNILYRYISFKMKDLILHDYLNYPYQFNWEYEDLEVSIYTPKYFDTYLHEVIG